MLSRRFFLAAGTGSLLSLCFPLTALAKLSSSTSAVSGIDPNLEAECMVYRDGLVIARLNLVGLSTPSRPDPRLDQYILNFEAAMPVDLAEANYEIAHPTLGRLHLFLQPCGTIDIDEHDGRQYRACMAMFR
ncbi:MAG: hypothetical protein QNL03_00425 [Gammaproteobacteria bacterium]|nr:hypothetical protein [Gammaproteobacteria bacterium]